MSSTLIFQITIFIFCFILVWYGSDIVVTAISSLSKSWRLPAFTVSFFILGLLTSLPEITISAVALMNNDPVIIAGNLLGGVIIMFLVVIPLLGLVGNGVKIPTQLDKKLLVSTLIVVVAPAFLTADQKISQWEAAFLILLYLSLLVFFSFRQSFFSKVKHSLSRKKTNSHKFLFKIIIGVLILIAASYQIVQSTIYLANYFSISSFFVGLIIIALGTNIPEIAIIFRSVSKNKKSVALADYLGSASSNTLLLGVFTLIYGKTIYLPAHFFQRFMFLALGLILFFIFARSRNHLSRLESLILLSLYFIFVIIEIYILTQ